MAIDIVILAAGKGTRMCSQLPKVLHPLGGKPLLAHVIATAAAIADARISVVVGHGAEQTRKAFSNYRITWVEQSEQKGTAHAVAQAAPHIDDDGAVLILYGDVPLIGQDTLTRMLAAVGERRLALLTVEPADTAGYGRILRNGDGEVIAIVEHRDASAAQLAIKEVNTGVIALRSADLKRWLPQIEANNAHGEYYLTDIIGLARRDGGRVQGFQPSCAEEVEGVNTRAQLAHLERHYQRGLAEQLMAAGATLADPARFDCRGRLVTGWDTRIDIDCVFEGDVTLGANVVIGPCCVIKDAVIGDHVVIKAHTVIEGPVSIAAGVEVGPFARLRPGTQLAAGVRIGNFVETKKAVIGVGSKANHLSYIGDTRIGAGVNVGAGTITCNYDGVNKHVTDIGDGAFIGSNTALVAPVVIGSGATVGAGSTITKDVPANNLAVARGKQHNLNSWRRPMKPGQE
ncbi:MAG: bifunctional UDP-N-acetylglucosamine diphosphorylase/glucosamine-1-phosphate N-acetyltransferase GlmU [Porticoccaceae bacterium]